MTITVGEGGEVGRRVRRCLRWVRLRWLGEREGATRRRRGKVRRKSSAVEEDPAGSIARKEEGSRAPMIVLMISLSLVERSES